MVKKLNTVTNGVLSLIIAILSFVEVAEAVPAFARQTGMACNTCHYESYPALNGFGRNFKSNGFTMKGSQTNIEGDRLSLPANLNVSIITKIRYELKGDAVDNRGEIQWPDEAALLVGGRVSENVGFLMELGLGPQEGEADTTTGAVETGGSFLSTKFHFNLSPNLAIIPFSTDGLGVGYGFELMNTGIQRSQRPIENRKGFSAAQLLGTASGGATGVAFVYAKPTFYVNYSHWAPTWGNVHTNLAGGLAHYFRAVYTPNLQGWDSGVGFAAMTGSIDIGDDDPAETVYVNGWTLDVQTQGIIYNMPLGVYGSYGIAPKSKDNEVNHYNSSTENDAAGIGLLAKLSVRPKTSAYVGYSSLDDGNKASSFTLGLQYMVAQNLKLELYRVISDSEDDGDDYTMLMLFAGL